MSFKLILFYYLCKDIIDYKYYAYFDNMIKEGLTAQSHTVVTVENSAARLGSGDLEVFATPAMVALMENAAMNAVSASLEEGETTVGVSMSTSHIKASAMGAEITATAEVISIEGRKITFRISASDKDGLIGEGDHVRFVVNREKFMSKLKG